MTTFHIFPGYKKIAFFFYQQLQSLHALHLYTGDSFGSIRKCISYFPQKKNLRQDAITLVTMAQKVQKKSKATQQLNISLKRIWENAAD